MLVVPPLLGWILLRGGDQAGDSVLERMRWRALRRQRWRELSAFVLGVGLVLAASVAHNLAAAGSWVLTTTNAGQNFYIGNNPLNRSGEYERLPFVDPNPKFEEADFAREAARRAGRPLGAAEVSRFWFRESWSWIRQDPGAWAALAWRKLRAFWGAYEIPDTVDYYLFRRSAPVLRLGLPGFGLVAPLGLLGAALALRQRTAPVLLLFLLVYSLSVIAFFVFSRFRMAALPALFILAGHGAVELYRRWRAAVEAKGPFGRALLPTGLLLALIGFVNLPVRAHADALPYRLAETLGLPRRAETSSAGHYNLGLAYAARAREAEDPGPLLELAESELRRALRDETRYASVYVELGKVLARQRRDGEAIELYRRALSIEPADYRSRHALGLLLRRVNDPAAAALEFGEALRLEPRHAASATRLGEVLLELGGNEEAQRAFRHALGLDPGDRAAAAGLARAQATGAAAPEQKAADDPAPTSSPLGQTPLTRSSPDDSNP